MSESSHPIGTCQTVAVESIFVLFISDDCQLLHYRQDMLFPPSVLQEGLAVLLVLNMYSAPYILYVYLQLVSVPKAKTGRP